MADNSHAGEHHGGNFGTYMAVAVALAVCTAISFIVNQNVESKVTAFLIILSVAILKAALVGWVFMHLKWDWRLVYFLLIPVFIMATMMVVVLLPDALFGPYHDAQEALDIARDASEMP
jgi:caa(3)-type oxidase subunit IV